MRMSQLLGERYKEKPSDATIASHIYLLRGGYIRHVGNGIYTLLPPAKRVAMKIERILREEMDALGGQEVLFPVSMPAALWQESGRYQSVGKELLRFTDRNGVPMVLGMTHEEAAVLLAKTEAQTYAKYPFFIYQIQTKFRDEPRSRGGLIRVREFTMKDGYSYHTSQEDLEKFYIECYRAYERIYARAGIPEVVSVASDSGMMGGSLAHEFMLLCDAGEDTIAICAGCGYRSNVEAARTRIRHEARPDGTVEKVETPNTETIDDLAAFFGLPKNRFIKSAVFAVEGSDKVVVVFLRGDYEVNEAKLCNHIGENVFPLAAAQEVQLSFGCIGPYALNNKDVQVLFDVSLEGEADMVCGANEAGFHYKGVSVARDLRVESFADLYKVNDGDICPECGGALRLSRGIEVGHVFQLGGKYTKAMDMTYTDENGKAQHPIMGCYGIGVGRMISCIIEARHDDWGPVWPYSVAPWQVHICALNRKKGNVAQAAESVYDRLKGKYETILDDRDAQAGIQFADADLLGVPIRVIVSPKNIENGQVEIVTRDKSIKEIVPLEQLDEAVEKVAAALMDKLTI